MSLLSPPCLLGNFLIAALSAIVIASADAGPLPLRAQVIDSAIQIGYGLAVADVDGDGRDDILLADAKEVVWYRNPSWEKFVIARQLTTKDHVCITARDLDGDGKAEIAVGAEWNPGDTVGSGAVFYLQRPGDPTQPWRPIRLPHEPTTHRMHWIEDAGGAALLAVLPLHGRGNKNGEGEGIRFLGYRRPADVDEPWPTVELHAGFHLAHNFETPLRSGSLLVAAKEGVHRLTPQGKSWSARRLTEAPAGEVREGRTPDGSTYLATIEPMHGNQVVVYPKEGSSTRILLDESLIQGHALATGDVLGLGHDQVVAGWRGGVVGPSSRVGIRLYAASDAAGASWELRGLIDDNTMACEDLRLADLDRDGDLEVIASGRATKNVVIYWNDRLPSVRTPQPP